MVLESVENQVNITVDFLSDGGGIKMGLMKLLVGVT
jgi:hypothetical protein